MEEATMRGKVCLVTGATTGIGREVALGLAQTGATVVLACRTKERGEAARAYIAERSGSTSCDILTADLSLLTSISRLAKEFRKHYPRLDVLVNNAGANFSRRTLTPDGIEATLATNFVGPFLLTNLLLDVLKASAPARVVNVASGMLAPVEFDDLRREKGYKQMAAYAQSKMALVMFTYELSRRLEGSGVTANCMTPGMVRTSLGRDVKGFLRLFLTIMSPMMKSPKQGAEGVVRLASAPGLASVSGKFFKKDGAEGQTPEQSYDPDACRRVWEMGSTLSQFN